MKALYDTEVKALGEEVDDLYENGHMFILFHNEFATEELKDICVCHSPMMDLAENISRGDLFVLDGDVFPVTVVGDYANGTLSELGHVTVRWTEEEKIENWMPGEIIIRGCPKCAGKGSRIQFGRLKE